MSYGVEETPEGANSSRYNKDYWSSPPSDINSEEYRIWYERYCSYFYPQTAAEDSTTSSSVDTSNAVKLQDALPVSNSTVDTSTTSSTAEAHSDHATNDTVAGEVSGKKRKKNKKDGVANPKPAEPPGTLPYHYLSFWVTTSAEALQSSN